MIWREMRGNGAVTGTDRTIIVNVLPPGRLRRIQKDQSALMTPRNPGNPKSNEGWLLSVHRPVLHAVHGRQPWEGRVEECC